LRSLCAVVLAGFALLAPQMIVGGWGTQLQAVVVQLALRAVGIRPADAPSR
jgi:hypothetical protein